MARAWLAVLSIVCVAAGCSDDGDDDGDAQASASNQAALACDCLCKCICGNTVCDEQLTLALPDSSKASECFDMCDDECGGPSGEVVVSCSK